MSPARHTKTELTGPTGRPSISRRWLHEPLLHFLLAGVALFVLYRTLNPQVADRAASTQIRLTEDDIRQMTMAWLAQGRPPPTPEQVKSLVEARVREEIFFREAIALGLDKNDTIVRRRLAQKMEFLAEDLSGIGDPSPDEIKLWFERNAARFALPPRASFHHRYFSPDRRGARARDDAAHSLDELAGEPADAPSAAEIGDPFMFQDYFGDRSFDQIATVFGANFALSLVGLNQASWQGPIESGYGWHLIWIDELTQGRVPALAEVEPEVKREWIAEQRAEAERRVYEAIRARYVVVLPGNLSGNSK